MKIIKEYINTVLLVIIILIIFLAPKSFGARTADPYSDGWTGDCQSASTTTVVEGIVADCN